MEAWTTAEKPNLSWSHPWATAPITAIVSGFMGMFWGIFFSSSDWISFFWGEFTALHHASDFLFRQHASSSRYRRLSFPPTPLAHLAHPLMLCCRHHTHVACICNFSSEASAWKHNKRRPDSPNSQGANHGQLFAARGRCIVHAQPPGPGKCRGRGVPPEPRFIRSTPACGRCVAGRHNRGRLRMCRRARFQARTYNPAKCLRDEFYCFLDRVDPHATVHAQVFVSLAKKTKTILPHGFTTKEEEEERRTSLHIAKLFN